jgi:hypothetical protein
MSKEQREKVEREKSEGRPQGRRAPSYTKSFGRGRVWMPGRLGGAKDIHTSVRANIHP